MPERSSPWVHMAKRAQSEMDPQRPATMNASPQVRIIGFLEEQPLLEKVQKQVTRMLQPLVDAADAIGLKDVLHGRQIGHALHPIATDLPIGFWMSAVLLDVVGAKKSARLLTGAGCASALVAVASGT